jgi:predicted acetyltransferase
MVVSLRDARQSHEDRQWIERAYREYLDDLGAGGTGVFPALAVTGQDPQELLGSWFRDQRSTPFVILRGGERAGFALVQQTSVPGSGPLATFRLTEFFISRPMRRLGVGGEAARLLFDRFQGQWLVPESTRHRQAVEFWRRVIRDYTRGRYRERLAGDEVQQTFTSWSQPHDPA